METITEQIEKFKKETGISLEIKDGKPYCGGNLNLRETAITSLPDTLVVGGNLNLRETAITSLPDNLVVGGSLDLHNTAITSLPDNLVVGGWLDLSYTAITSLPDNLVVGGLLDLRGTAITSLPDNLVVGGWLDLQGSAITCLLYTSDAADDLLCVYLGGRRIIKKKNMKRMERCGRRKKTQQYNRNEQQPI